MEAAGLIEQADRELSVGRREELHTGRAMAFLGALTEAERRWPTLGPAPDADLVAADRRASAAVGSAVR